MPEKKVNDSIMLAMLDKGKKQTEVAKFFNVSPQAISDRFKKLRGGVVKNVVLEAAPKIVEQKLNAVQQLYDINQDAREILDLVMGWARGDEKCIRVLETQVKKVKWRDKESDKDRELDVQEIKFKDPRELALKAMTVIEGQLRLQLDIFKTLYGMDEVAAFQKEIIQLLRETDPELKNEFIRRLKKRQALRSDALID